jgi:hypothetical protein
MTRYRRWLFVGLTVVGSQIAAGCCYNRPVLFPRLNPCVGGCGPIFPRLAAVPGPVVSGPVYDAPVYGGPPPCVGCGGHDGGFGVPIASTPPVVYGPPPGAPGGTVAPPPSFSVPMNMPGAAAPVGAGIPFDSALAPTVRPPTGAARADAPPDSKKLMLTAGK